ncbi:hypothetical protein EJV47_03255 [Hymenobacter gummosus]|uniref:SH3 domain-containing protein n=1 Tax=Hymenobacter gummosus TaxID=1776032 RepID=A0A431U9Y1_9BACT|nr:hypothetical protein [Hymenobacter gummosus]RTQ53765.1 hypothetical protein EJV47_03255 [Hymenobacter gummosus]
MIRLPLYLLGSALLLACSQERPGAAARPTEASTDSVTAAATRDSIMAQVGEGFEFSDSTTSFIKWPAPFQPDAARQCRRRARRAVVIYQRPAAGAAKFGQLAAGEEVTLAARTAAGWVGFDPGTAQAANVGIFRLRWVRAAEAFAPADSCARLPLVDAPPAGCLLMAARPVEGRMEFAPDMFMYFTIPTGSYARVLQAARPDAQGRILVAVPGWEQPGYVDQADVSLSGPCR